MRILTQTEFRLEAEPWLRHVFVNDDQFDQPFSESIVERRIIYPCEGYIEPPIIDSVIKAAGNLGDTGCYFSLLPTAFPGDAPSHCYFSLSEFLNVYCGSEEDGNMIELEPEMDLYALDSVIYSASGRWGLMTSHERHGLLGGSVSFINEIRASVPDLDDQVYGFLDRLRFLLVDAGIVPPDVARNKWLPGLLTHVYGREAAQSILLQR